MEGSQDKNDGDDDDDSKHHDVPSIYKRSRTLETLKQEMRRPAEDARTGGMAGGVADAEIKDVKPTNTIDNTSRKSSGGGKGGRNAGRNGARGRSDSAGDAKRVEGKDLDGKVGKAANGDNDTETATAMQKALEEAVKQASAGGDAVGCGEGPKGGGNARGLNAFRWASQTDHEQVDEDVPLIHKKSEMLEWPNQLEAETALQDGSMPAEDSQWYPPPSPSHTHSG